MPTITFVGTGGGRFVTMTQKRLTGGLIFEEDKTIISIDPGPSAAIGYRIFGIPIWRVSGVIVTHGHPDHYSEADVVIEGMTRGGTKKNGFLAISEYMHRLGYGVSPYHRKVVSEYIVMKEGMSFTHRGINFKIFKTKHTEPTTVGLKINVKNHKIVYVADTAFFDGLKEIINDSDLVILPVTLPRRVSLPHHLNTEDTAKLLTSVDINLCIITHFGLKMIESDPTKEAEWLRKTTGQDVIAAFDGMRIEL